MSPDSEIAVVGVPLDANSSFLRGAAAAPAAIRAALGCPSSNLCAENGIDLGADSRWRDAGDIGSAERQPSAAMIEEILARMLG